MQLPHVFIAFFMCDEAFPHVFIAFWHPQASFWEPIGLSWGLLFGMWEGLWSFLGILWVPNGARNIKMRVSKAILVQVEVASGSQRLSMGRFWEDFITCSVLFGMLVCFFVRNVLCIMVAASHCSCFPQCVGRGQGSAAGAAEDHMTRMLDTVKCMGLFTYCVLFCILVCFL